MPTFEERFKYLQTNSQVGVETFAGDRYLNQRLYHDPEWKSVRLHVMERDGYCDLGVKDGNHVIPGRIEVHHINPITEEDIINRDPIIFNPDNLITVWAVTHKALHYSNIDLLPREPVERRPNDTCPWRN